MTRDKTSFSSDPEENPAFHNFGKIYVPYCSSDVYTGTRNFAVQNAKIERFYFHGRHIIDAVGDAIIKDKPDIGSLKQVVFMGNSAGAAGVTKNCDFLAEKFKRANPNIDFRCISDGGDFRVTEEFLINYTDLEHQVMILDWGAPMSLAGIPW